MSRVDELKKQINQLEEELFSLAPFLATEKMANKKFGEWSEDYILSKVPVLNTHRGMGKDMFSESLGNIEVKSTRNPHKFTFNQIKPEYSDYHIFISYDLESANENIFLVPNTDLVRFSMSKQHNYEEGHDNCYTLSSTITNKKLLEEYRVTWEELNGKAGK